MSLSIPPRTSSNASAWRSTAVCQKMLWFCYYYSRCFGMVAFGIKKCKEDHNKLKNILPESSSIMKETLKHTNSIRNTHPNLRRRYVLQPYVSKYILWLHILLRSIICSVFSYGMLNVFLTDDDMFIVIFCAHVLTVAVCPPVMLIIEIWHRKRLIGALNDIFRLFHAIQTFHSSYEIFQWTHVVFIALKITTFIYEIIIPLLNIEMFNDWFSVLILIVQTILLIVTWLNIHVVTLLYICIEAMYGSLNHYMRHSFRLRLKAVQTYDPVSTSMYIKKLTDDMKNFIGLFKRVHCVGLNLHYLWQIPLASTLVSVHFGAISILYYLIWQYFEEDVIHMRFVPYALKIVIDIMLLALAAHNAIKKSQLIGSMGLENVVLLENEDWHRQVRAFCEICVLY